MSISSLAMQAGAQMAPDFMLSVNAKDVTANIRNRLISLTLIDNRGFEADQLDLELDDADGLLAMPIHPDYPGAQRGLSRFSQFAPGNVMARYHPGRNRDADCRTQ